ncbi:MAG TPA: hypothetical protein VFC34_08500 [Puia sp.]|nr:hypothetical protein [Puia sp.]
MYKTSGPLSVFMLLTVVIACNSVYTPKPRGYFRIDFPKHEYQSFNRPDFPYSFDYPVYGEVVRDTSFFGDRPENPYWINIDFPRFHARIYISYKKVEGNNFVKLREDAYKMTYKNTYKATSIEDSLISTPLGVHGIFSMWAEMRQQRTSFLLVILLNIFCVVPCISILRPTKIP